MNPLAHHLYTQACNNAWANLRIARACAALDDAAFTATRTGFFPSLRATLNHILTVDWLYVDAIERGLRGQPVNREAAQFFDPPEPFLTCATLTVAQRAVDGRLIALCEGLEDLGVVVQIQRADHVQREPLVRVLAHLFQHQVHHRGQAHAMLSGTSLVPPQLDEFFLAEEAPLRAEELAALGLREDQIWDAGRTR